MDKPPDKPNELDPPDSGASPIQERHLTLRLEISDNARKSITEICGAIKHVALLAVGFLFKL